MGLVNQQRLFKATVPTQQYTAWNVARWFCTGNSAAPHAASLNAAACGSCARA